MAKGERIGVMGGTFDPLHLAHLALAEVALEQAELDRVLMVVANDPWQKTAQRSVSPAEVRLAAVEAAVEELPGVEASRIELDRGGSTYTVDTLEALARDLPVAELFLIVGSDTASGLETWIRPRDVAALATVLVVNRPGAPLFEIGPQWRTHRLEMDPVELSSTELRSLMAAGEDVARWVPRQALDVYRSAGLYA